MIKLIKSNLLIFKEDILCHGVNCQGSFGSGVAGQLAKIYPEVRERYLEKYNTEGWKLGDVQEVKVNNQYIVNCATQENYGYDGKLYISYDAIEECMKKVKYHAKENNLTIAMPRIGAGLGGGDWTKIEDILLKVFNDYDVTVYVL